MSKPHHHHLVERMAAKGWHQEDLQEAYDIFESKKDKKHFLLNFYELPLHYLLFFMIIFGNMVIAAAALPLLVVYPNTAFYAILLTLGLCFGFLVEIVIKHIDHLLGRHHHFMLGVIIPAIAAVSCMVIVHLGATNLPVLIPETRNPVLVGILYGIAFVAPYVITRAITFLHEE